ncbi:MAG: hypothetical protein ACXWDD_12675 [Aeromicrobium sp.]
MQGLSAGHVGVESRNRSGSPGSGDGVQRPCARQDPDGIVGTGTGRKSVAVNSAARALTSAVPMIECSNGTRR